MIRYSLYGSGWLLLGIVSTIAVGCNSATQSATDYHVQGNVEFDGRPLPAGKIYFTPDSSQGNQGPQGAATIKEGKYDTRDSRFGIVGGPYLVRIEGYDGVQPANDEDNLFPDGQVVFRDYEIRIDFPKKDHVEDIVVPAKAAESSR